MNYLLLGPVFIITYMVAVDKNLADYLYLKLWAEPAVTIQTTLLKWKLLLSLRYDRFLLKRNIVPSRFYQMAKEFRDQADKSA